MFFYPFNAQILVRNHNNKDKALEIYRRLSKESRFEKFSLAGNLAAISILIRQPGNEHEVRRRFNQSLRSPLMIERKIRTYKELTTQYFENGPLDTGRRFKVE